MRTIYQSDLIFDDGYMSDYIAIMRNLEGIYALPPEFDANSTEFDTAVSVNSNVEMDGSQYDLNINAEAALKSKGTLRNHQEGQRKQPRVLTKSSEIPAGAVVKMMTKE